MPPLDSHTPNTPAWFDLMTTDAAAARAFYGGLFGWTFDVQGPELGHYAIALRHDRVAAGIGAIAPAEDGTPAYPPAWTVYFAVEDADKTVAAAMEGGGNVMVPPMDVGVEGRMAILADSTGAVFGLWQPHAHKGAQVIREHGAMTWCEVNTRDADAACAFYGELFGLEARPLETGGDGAGVTYFTLHKGDITAAGVMQMTAAWGELPAHWMAYFGVDDTDAAAQKVVELGGEVLHGPFDTPYGRMAVIKDPQGAVLSIVSVT